MVKFIANDWKKGTTFCLPQKWCEKITEELKNGTMFSDAEITNNGYFCETSDKSLIFISESVKNYITGVHFSADEARYFSDCLPDEGDKLLILDSETQAIYPVQFVLSVSLENDVPCLDFKLVSLLDNKTSYSMDAHMNNSWKLLHSKDVYMTASEKMYQDTFIHKEYVLQVCSKFAAYLEAKGLIDEAEALRERAIVHDNSKITNQEEFNALTGIIDEKSCLENASAQLTKFKQDSIRLHWQNNAHHPEHFEDYDEMSKLDRMEMCCDWMSRSLQYKSDLLSFVKTRQEERFHFSDTMFEEVYHYCEILVALYA